MKFKKIMRDKRSLIGLLALAVVCSGLLALACVLLGGTLALRKALASRAETAVETRQAPALSETPTLIQVASPTPSRKPTRTPRPTNTPFPSPTLVQSFPETSLTPSPTIPVVLRDAWCVPWNSPSVQAQVVKVIDGVTFEAAIGGEVRQVSYIGIDLLEYGGMGGTESDPATWAAMTEKNRELVEGKQALLVEGMAGGGQEGVLQRYVIVEGVFVNLELVKSGYAVARSTPPDNVCEAAFSQAEMEAISAGRGLWAPTPTPTRTLIPPSPTVSASGDVIVINVAKRGNGWQEPDEYVEIYNAGETPVQLEGWSVSDIQNHIFRFPRFVLGGGQYCRVYTDRYQPTHCGFNFHNPAPIWDNNGDCAYLRDKTGKLVNEFCYE